ncbi:MAG: GNAT family N-acetyltransferase [Actinomycetota bacterium]
MELGRARPEDVPLIEALLRANDWDLRDIGSGVWFVARDGDEPVGTVRITDIDDVRYVDDVLVAADRRGDGIGASLMRVVLEDRRALSYLVCHDERIAFYERLGYTRVDESDAPDAVREHAVGTEDLPSRPDHVHHLMRRDGAAAPDRGGG